MATNFVIIPTDILDCGFQNAVAALTAAKIVANATGREYCVYEIQLRC